MEHTMALKLVTCPETAHLEAIGCLVAGDGELVLVTRCSRFDPPELLCDSQCIKLLNRRRATAGGT
jgi:hypothetical protein